MIPFDNTYLLLPNAFYSLVKPLTYDSPTPVLENKPLASEFNLPEGFMVELLDSGTTAYKSTLELSFAQAYAGHQYGHFTMLGDGRAIVLGERISNNKRFDFQLKGSGITPYSRRGDGKATLSAMLREYIISETMVALNIPTSRTLSVIATGEIVNRENPEHGAVLGRIMKSHLRIGTFEFARYYLDNKSLLDLLNYSIDRLYPECANATNPALAFIQAVALTQFELVAQWMRVGFIHGVMNTDNTAISGESFDYGPCAFMNHYDLTTVFSSIDTQGRYAYGHQGSIIQWNMVRLAEALLPSIDTDEEKAINMATEFISQFDDQWKRIYESVMIQKIGFCDSDPETLELLNDLLKLMAFQKLDFTNTFAGLTYPIHEPLSPWKNKDLIKWKTGWKQLLKKKGISEEIWQERMIKSNPVVIPRNNKIEEILKELSSNVQRADKNLKFKEAIDQWTDPYHYHPDKIPWMTPPPLMDDATYRTYCGT